MDNQFNFDKIGKRMPYTVPDDFFDTLEQNVMTEVKSKKRGHTIRIALGVVLGAAAAIALIVTVNKFMVKDAATPSTEIDLEQAYCKAEVSAFSNLSDEDQDYLMEVYEEDIFINNYTNTENL